MLSSHSLTLFLFYSSTVLSQFNLAVAREERGRERWIIGVSSNRTQSGQTIISKLLHLRVGRRKKSDRLVTRVRIGSNSHNCSRAVNERGASWRKRNPFKIRKWLQQPLHAAPWFAILPSLWVYMFVGLRGLNDVFTRYHVQKEAEEAMVSEEQLLELMERDHGSDEEAETLGGRIWLPIQRLLLQMQKDFSGRSNSGDGRQSDNTFVERQAAIGKDAHGLIWPLMTDLQLLQNMQSLIGIYIYETVLAVTFKCTTLKLLRFRKDLLLHHLGSLVMQAPFILSPDKYGITCMKYFQRDGNFVHVPFFSRQVLNCYTATGLNELMLALMQMADVVFKLQWRQIPGRRPFIVLLLAYVDYLWIKNFVTAGYFLRSSYVDPATGKKVAFHPLLIFHAWAMFLCTPTYHTLQIILPNVKKLRRDTTKVWNNRTVVEKVGHIGSTVAGSVTNIYVLWQLNRFVRWKCKKC